MVATARAVRVVADSLKVGMFIQELVWAETVGFVCIPPAALRKYAPAFESSDLATRARRAVWDY
jgi:hypothetical protein